MATKTKTQKSTKVTDEERFERLGDMRKQIRDTDPNLSNREVDRKAHEAVGLEWGGDDEVDDVPKGGRPRAAARKSAEATGSGARKLGSAAKSTVTSGSARKTIFGVLILGLGIGVFRDFRSGAAIRTDVVPRRIVGSFIAGILLMTLAGPAPKIARGLAFLVGFTIVVANQETISQIAGSTDEEVDREGGVTPEGSNSAPAPPEITPGQPS